MACSGERDSGYGDGHELIGGEVFGRGKSGGYGYGERPERGEAMRLLTVSL